MTLPFDTQLETIYATDRQAWRQWLQRIEQTVSAATQNKNPLIR